MPFDISEIKKLPIKERLRIIDELWESIDAERDEDEQLVLHEEQAKYGVEEDEEEESDEVITMLEERWERYKRGEGRSYTIEEIREILDNKLKEKKDDADK